MFICVCVFFMQTNDDCCTTFGSFRVLFVTALWNLWWFTMFNISYKSCVCFYRLAYFDLFCFVNC